VFANANGVFTPGMFARVRVPGSPPYEGLLVPDVAIGTEQARRYVVVVDDQDTARIKYVTLGQLTSDNLRVIKEGIGRDDRVVVDGLMQARPGTKVHAEEQGEAARRRRRESAATVKVAGGASACAYLISYRPADLCLRRLDHFRDPRRAWRFGVCRSRSIRKSRRRRLR
jgi:choline dehydrogenase-like flavoprotein